MKWKTKRIPPKIGDRRTKRRFALFPVITDYDYTVWLETYDSVQQYVYRRRPTKAGTIEFADWDEIETIPLFVSY